MRCAAVLCGATTCICSFFCHFPCVLVLLFRGQLVAVIPRCRTVICRGVVVRRTLRVAAPPDCADSRGAVMGIRRPRHGRR